MCLRIIHFEIFIHTSGNIIFKIIICLLLNTFLLFSTAFLSQEILGVRAHLSKYWRGTWPEKVLITPVLNPVPSPRRIFRVRSPPNKAPSPQIETWNTINQWSFCQFLECQATQHKRKAPLLKTFWQRFCLNLGDRLNENVFCFDWFITWFTGLRANKWNRTLAER